MLSKYDCVFNKKHGEINFELTLHMKDNAVPKFCKARTVPFSLKEATEKELDHLEQDGIIEKITYSPCTAPMALIHLYKLRNWKLWHGGHGN